MKVFIPEYIDTCDNVWDGRSVYGYYDTWEKAAAQLEDFREYGPDGYHDRWLKLSDEEAKSLGNKGVVAMWVLLSRTDRDPDDNSYDSGDGGVVIWEVEVA